jgi:benzylsuccinate CoA-transferase BbsF subunit
MGKLPLEGVRIVDFSWIIAGPTATRHLAMMGAEVIKVGSARRPDPSAAGPPFQAYNQSKRYVALNLSKPEGTELARALIAISDVVVENFAVGVFERRGLGYDVISADRPDVIMVSSSGTGHSGPDKDYVAYGSLLQHYTGWNSISGFPNREPIKGGLWADPWVGLELAMLTVAALDHRLLTGQGQYIDYSMAEALTAGIPEAVLDYQMNGRMPEPMGNDDRTWAPHGVYHCKGTDTWVAIAVTNDEEWESLCRVVGREEMATDSRLATARARMRCKDELDAAITSWTERVDGHEAMRTLQEAGVPAGPSLDVGRLFEEPQLRETGYFTERVTSDGEPRDLPGLPWRSDQWPEARVTAAPVLGQDNDYVYRELLGLPEPAIERLVRDQVIY